MTLYRDPITGRRSQVATKRGLLLERLEKITPVLRSLAPASLRARIAPVPPAEEALPSDVEALAGLEASIDDALAAADDILAAEARLRRCPLDVEPFPRSTQPPPWLIEEAGLLDFRRRWTSAVRVHAPEPELVRWGDAAYRARFAVRGSPVEALVRVEGTDFDMTRPYVAVVRTSVPEHMPLVSVRRERMTDAIGKMLGVAREIRVGRAAVDEAFWIAGDADAATALAPIASAALLELVAAEPELAFGRGLAELRWSGRVADGGARLFPQAALDVVLGIREAVEAA